MEKKDKIIQNNNEDSSLFDYSSNLEKVENEVREKINTLEKNINKKGVKDKSEIKKLDDLKNLLKMGEILKKETPKDLRQTLRNKINQRKNNRLSVHGSSCKKIKIEEKMDENKKIKEEEEARKRKVKAERRKRRRQRLKEKKNVERENVKKEEEEGK